MPTINGDHVYHAKVVEVHSGDDLVLMVDLGIDNLYKKVRARLGGVDTPDAYKADRNSEAGAVRETVRSLTNNKSCSIQVQAQNKSSWKVILFITEGKDPANYVNLNEHLKEKGYVYHADNRATA